MFRNLAAMSILGLAAACCCLTGATGSASAAERFVLQIRLDDAAITPPVARFMNRAIRRAEAEHAECLIVVLDTPGGLVDSTRDIVKTMLRSRVPVVVYVAPQGARAASAGVFITFAAHISAMAPGTNIGAAHPVQIGGLPGSPPPSPTKKGEGESQPAAPMDEKIVNDTVAWVRALAELRGRNADWATRAVKESLSAPASEAVQENAVDLLAVDVNDLLRQIHGREVRLPDGAVRLHTSDVEIRIMEMWWGDRLLGALANPNVAFLLLLFGFYGILFELYTPGWGVAGTIGIICLVLGFFALAILPINYVGLALIALGLGLFVAEVFVTSYGFLTIGGVACLILGGLMLVDSPAGFQRISLWVLIPISLATAAITFVLVGGIVKAHRKKAMTGPEALVSAEAVAVDDFVEANGHFQGTVRTRGELWRAISSTPVAAGQAVQIQKREGLTLMVSDAKGATP